MILPLSFGDAGDLGFEVVHVVVAELQGLREAEPHAVDDRGVVHGVEERHVVATEQAGEHAQIDLEAGGEDQRSLTLHERREAVLELHVDVEGAVEQA